MNLAQAQHYEPGSFHFDSAAATFDGLPDHFNSAWRAVSQIRECAVADVDGFIRAHYLRKRPAIVSLCLKMFVRNVPVGAILYSVPPSQTTVRYGGLTWELARLYLRYRPALSARLLFTSSLGKQRQKNIAAALATVNIWQHVSIGGLRVLSKSHCLKASMSFLRARY